MKLSIITINYNKASGLKKTIESVVNQASHDFEYIIIDGGSTDGSVDIIKSFTHIEPITCWISEPDHGIYHAMNKGIRIAKGEYVQFLNSGDCLVNSLVTGQMLRELEKHEYPTILYGNMLKQMTIERVFRDRCFNGQEITFLGMFTGTLNHSPAYIKHCLFDKYGLYDESLKIVSDWKWYMLAIILGSEHPVYTDIDVTLFDMHGISNTNPELDQAERKQVLEELFPAAILNDYERFAFPIEQIKRLKRYPWAYKMVWFLERCLFKYEKWFKNKEQIYR